MAGYWPNSFFACLWPETKQRSINSQKKERGQYPAILTEQTWSIKDLLYGFGEILLAGYSGQSRVGKMAPSCLLGQPITARLMKRDSSWREIYEVLVACHFLNSKVLAARMRKLTAHASKNKRTARVLANACKDHSIPLHVVTFSFTDRWGQIGNWLVWTTDF